MAATDWSIVVPEATTNLLKDPSFEFGTLATYWTTDVAAGSGTAALSTAAQKWGVRSVLLTPGSAGVILYQSAATGAGSHTLTCYARRTDGGVLTASDLVAYIDGAAVAFDSITAIGRGWYRCLKTATETAAAHNTGVKAPIGGSAVYVDAVQFEAKAYATTYCDGDQDGCSWNGVAHTATSQRSAQHRLGGKDVTFDSLGLSVLAFSGGGMPPVQNLTQERALLPGASYRGIKVLPQVLQLALLFDGADSPAAWHLLRQNFIDVVKPDLVTPKQPFLLRYRGAGATVELACVYDGGLEIGPHMSARERVPLRVIAYDDPYWHEEGENGQAVTVSQNLTVNRIVAKINGAWTALGNPAMTDDGSGIEVACLALSHDGQTLYAGGSFLNLNGIANADYIAAYDLATGTWSALGTGASGAVLNLAVAANGDLYASGTFATMGGVTVNSIARWDGSAWHALGTGVTNGGVRATVTAMALSETGMVYVGGAIDTAGGVAVNNAAQWNGSAWSALGTGFSSIDVQAMIVDKTGVLYVGGSFVNAGGVANTAGIARWTGSAWQALSASGGASGAVKALAFGLGGELYIGGGFTTIGGVTCNGAAKWNGSAYSPLGGGTNGGDVLSLAVDSKGMLYLSGTFTALGGLALADRVGQWNGSAYLPLDIDLPGAPIVQGLAVAGENLFVGFTTTGAASLAYGLAFSASAGRASAYPILTVKRAGGTGATLQMLKNETSGQVILFNYALADGETATIDLRPGRKSVQSSAFGNRLSKVLGGSDLASWALLPGSNQLSFYVVLAGSPTVTATLRWRTTHWGADGGTP